MPISLNFPASAEEIENFIHTWLDYLAREDYRTAYHMTVHDPYYEWTPELMEKMINGYGFFPEPNDIIFKVTDWRTATNMDRVRYNEISFFEKAKVRQRAIYSIIGDIWYDLPLNGQWSEVTATFNILRLEDLIYIELNEIHVF